MKARLVPRGEPGPSPFETAAGAASSG